MSATSAGTSAARWACDTSFAIAALDESHEGHGACRAALLAHRPALAGHAAFETYSALTRLPLPLRLDPPQAAAVMAAAFPTGCWLGATETAALLRRLPSLGVAGGSVYDALVGHAAAADGRTLLTRDRRAARTYRLLHVDVVSVE